MVVAADHTARGILGAGAERDAMADRARLLDRLCLALSRPEVNGVLGTADVLDDLLLLGVLDDKVVLGSMNRGGLAGASFEIDDRFTGYDPAGIEAAGFEGGKMLLRIDPDDPASAQALEACATAVSDLAARGLMAMVEPFMAHRGSGVLRNDLTTEAVVRSVTVAAGLGSSSAHTWLKLPVVTDGIEGWSGCWRPRRCRRSCSAARCPRTPTRRTRAGAGAAAADRDGPGDRSGPALPRRRRRRRRRRPRGEPAVTAAARPVRRPGHAAVQPGDHPDRAGWGHAVAAGPAAGPRRVVTASPPGRRRWSSLPLAGSCEVRCDGEQFTLTGRRDVFSGISDMVYVPRDASVEITSAGGGRFALAGARCSRRLPARYRDAHDVPVETRGAGACSRQVNNFCAADSFEADRLIAVEVLTPSGNWSSYPPHKHDEDRPGEESALEEIYYFEVDGAAGWDTTGSTAPPDRPIEVLAEVRTGDVVLVPHGWHGPSMAAPGLRPLLPQRDGRTRRRAGLGDPRRPRARAGSAAPGPTSRSTRGCRSPRPAGGRP